MDDVELHPSGEGDIIVLGISDSEVVLTIPIWDKEIELLYDKGEALKLASCITKFANRLPDNKKDTSD